ncbi:MAG: transketolase family protein [Candidatus Atribacteria bacterium]|nr:transketolase family protein [Candidatus Atribacteria bacterium]
MKILKKGRLDMKKIDFKKYKGLTGRDINSRVLVDIGEIEPKTVLLGADALGSAGGNLFRDRFPERTFNFGIAESNMIGAAAGFAILDKIPICLIYGFVIARVVEQIRNDLCYNKKNVKILCQTATFDLAPGGVTHHGAEDVSFLCNFANITIIQPATPLETVAAAYQGILEHEGPIYLRFSRNTKEELYSPDDFEFKIGKAITLQNGRDITVIATGASVHIAKRAANVLKNKGIGVRLIDMHTLKPIDEEVIIKAAEETKGIVTVEDINVSGGLGAAVCRIVCQNNPVKVKNIAFPNNRFSIIGPSVNALNEYFDITAENIVTKAEQLLN